MTDITIPYKFTPREYQLPLLRAMDNGYKRAVAVWHRRAGKDLTVLNMTVKKMFDRVGTYYHAFPEYNQGRKIIWDGRDKDGVKFLDHFPKPLVKRMNATEMKVELTNGSIYQIIGADNYDSIVGSNPVGIVLSEWAVSDKYPEAWSYFRPMLAENGGWAVFVYTPRGRNHGWELYRMALDNPEWFCEVLTADDTKAISAKDIQAERDAGMSEDMLQQEFYCSFISSVENIVIPYELIEAAIAREVSGYDKHNRVAGLDVARFGDDRTAFVIRQGGIVQHIESWRNLDTMQTSARVRDAHKRNLFDIVCVDSIGIGAGVVDILRAAGVPVYAVNVSESAAEDSRCARLRDELWWKLREWFQERRCSFNPMIPKKVVDQLIADIQDIRYAYTGSQLIQIEAKQDMKKRIKMSPDLGDALCLTFANASLSLDHRNLLPKSRRTSGITNWRDKLRKSKWDGSYQEVHVSR